jgi:pyruvate dehydrogenase E2 component (dihydrolipoamide acetyltransferase)
MTQVIIGDTVRFVTPRARKALLSSGVSLEEVDGSGPNGRVTEADVLRCTAQTIREPIKVGASTSGRAAIAKQTVKSQRDIPHFFLQLEVSARSLVRLRRQILDQFPGGQTARVSLTDFFVAAIGRALFEMPEANAVWRNEELEQLPGTNVGLVVRTDMGGLIIPVLKNVEKLNLFKLAEARHQSVQAAKQGKLAAHNETAAISVTNLGTARVDSFAPIIDHNQSLMLAVGSVAMRPWVDESDQLTARETVKLCLAADHRVHDGVPAAQFLEIVAAELENPPRHFIRALAK